MTRAVAEREPRRLLAGVAVDLTYGVGGLAINDVGGSGAGINETLTDAVALSDSKVLVVGQLGSFGTGSWFVGRYQSNGVPDTSFGVGGFSTYRVEKGLSAYSVLPLDGGSFLVGGYKVSRLGSGGVWDQQPVIARYDSTGTLDQSFGTGGILALAGSGAVQDLGLAPDGAVIATGHIGQDGWDAFGAMWRISTSGAVDNSFGVGGRVTQDQGSYTQFIREVNVQPDGTLFARTSIGIAHYAANGSVLQSFGSATRGSAWVRQPDGSFFVAADGVSPSSNLVVRRFNSSGTLDTNFGVAGSAAFDFFGSTTNRVGELLVQADGKILVAASSFVSVSAWFTSYDFSLARLMPDGSFDSSFGVGGRLVDPFKSVAGDFGTIDDLDCAVMLPGGQLLALGDTGQPPPNDTSNTGDNIAIRRYVLDPDLDVHSGGPYSLGEASPFNVSAAGSTDANGTFTSFEWQYGYKGRYFTPQAIGETAQLTSTDDGPASNVIGLRVITSDGLMVVTSAVADVHNLSPTVDAGGPRLAAAGALFQLTPIVSDHVAEVFSGTIDWGDGTSISSFSKTSAVIVNQFSVNHTYAARGLYTITVNANDGDGGSASATTTVTVGDIVAKVFRDDDGDGLIAVGQSWSAGATAYIDSNANGALDSGEVTALTNAYGEALFTGLDVGSTYTLRVVVDQGWTLSAPLSGSANASPGTTSAAAAFGLTQRSMIAGSVFNDANGNGLRDVGEVQQSTVIIRAYLPTSPPTSVTATATDANGNFWIRGLAPGTYAIATTPSSGWVQTSPAARGFLVVTVRTAQRMEGFEFGVQQISGASISWTLFRDLNSNAQKDSAEPTIQARVIYLDANDNGALDAGEYNLISSSTGTYSFSQLQPGSYVVRELLPAGWVQSSPAAGGEAALRFTVVPGQAVTGANFGSNGNAVYYIHRVNLFTGDTYSIHAGSGPDAPFITSGNISGTTAAVFLTLGNGGDDTFVIDFADGSPFPTGGFNVNGSGGIDTIIVNGTPSAPDVVTFGTSASTIAGKNLSYQSVERLRFNGRGGGDTVGVNAATLAFDGTQELQSLALTNGGRADIGANALVFSPSTNIHLGDVASMIAAGRNGGAWDGGGIITSSANGNLTGIGVALGSEALGLQGSQLAIFSGHTVGASSILVKYTYMGDANLDGKINVDDYTRIDFNAALGATGWFNGDFNYDGKINVDDYTIIDFNVGIQGPLINAASAASSANAFTAFSFGGLLEMDTIPRAYRQDYSVDALHKSLKPVGEQLA